MLIQNQGRYKLLTVEARFRLEKRGLIVVPAIPFEAFGTQGEPLCCKVLLKRPDGGTEILHAHFWVPHFQPLEAQLAFLKHPHYQCVLPDMEKESVPVGAEIWVIGVAATGEDMP